MPTKKMRHYILWCNTSQRISPLSAVFHHTYNIVVFVVYFDFVSQRLYKSIQYTLHWWRWWWCWWWCWFSVRWALMHGIMILIMNGVVTPLWLLGPPKCILIVTYNTKHNHTRLCGKEEKKSYCRILRHRALSYPASF